MAICIHGNLDTPPRVDDSNRPMGCCQCYPYPTKGHPMTTPTLTPREALARISVALEEAERNGALPYSLEGMWEMADEALAAQPELPEPVTTQVEQFAVNRYRTVPDGLQYKVTAGDGTRAIWHGTKDECRLFVAKATEAFLDGAFAAQQAQVKREPMTESEIAQDMADGLFFEHPTKIVRAIEAHHGIGDKA